MMALHSVLIASGALLFSMLPSLAIADSDEAITLGGELARIYCADCHATGVTGESTYAPAPHFRDLNARYDVELLSEALVEGIVTAHPEMPEFEFDPDQAEAIIAYIKSLSPEEDTK
jgi:cytochrome c